MNNNVKSVLKTESKVIAYIVICLVIIVLGISYALFFQVKKNENNQIVKAGTLEFSYANGSEITTEGNEDCFIPTNYNDAINHTECEYNVSITNSGTLPGLYSITLTSIATDNPVGLDKLKVILKKEGTVENTYPKTISELNNEILVENEKIPAGGLINYTVQVYVDEETILATDDEKNIALQINGRAEVSTDEGINPKAPLKGTELLEEKEKEEQAKPEPQLMYDDTEDGNLRYIGASPNNYIDIGDKDSDGNPILWRIIGVMKNVYNAESGIKEDLIKIIRADSIGYYSWDKSATGVNGGTGVNEWSQADIMKLLNPESVYTKDEEMETSLYWNSESGQCHINAYNDEPCDFTSSGISEEARNKLAKVRWNTGTFATDDDSEWTASATYQAERSENNGKQYCTSQGGGDYCNDEIDRTTTWDGYIGLVNPSDFGYAVVKSARATCLAESMNYYNSDGCKEADWFTPNAFDVWTLNPVPDSSYASNVFSLSLNGNLELNPASFLAEIRPVGFLKSNTTITDALGTIDDPFVAS